MESLEIVFASVINNIEDALACNLPTQKQNLLIDRILKKWVNLEWLEGSKSMS